MDLTVSEAAEYFGVSIDTVRRRMLRGQLKSRKEPRPQGYIWMIQVDEDDHQAPHGYDGNGSVEPAEPDFSPNGSQVTNQSGSQMITDMEVATMEIIGLRLQMRHLEDRVVAQDKQLTVKDQQLDARAREIQELHVLLQRSQKALPVTPESHSPWWNFWRRR